MGFCRSTMTKVVLASALLMTGAVSAKAADFKPAFVAACKSDGDSAKACECRYKALKKPRNKDEEKLVIAVLQKNDARVEALVKKANNFRSVAIINSMTRGLMVCLKA